MDFECNEENYDAKGNLKKKVALKPAITKIYRGMRIFLTRNLDKREDFVNGMVAEIEDYDSESKCLEVKTRTGKRLAIHLYTEEVEDHGNVTCFPVRVGYACTVPKIQGSTLPHVTVWLDRAGCRAAAYVALSRVEYDKDYLLAGPLSPAHFVPAQ